MRAPTAIRHKWNAVCQCERGIFVICYLCINHLTGKNSKNNTDDDDYDDDDGGGDDGDVGNGGMKQQVNRVKSRINTKQIYALYLSQNNCYSFSL